jgi:hypothetical protein
MGSRWLDESGRTVIKDDARVCLPEHGIAPGEQVELPLSVHAPETPGRYHLEIDMLQEGVTWFKDQGSTAARIPVAVRKRRLPLTAAVRLGVRLRRFRPVTPRARQDEPRMEMHVLPECEILDLVRNHGGKVVDVQTKVGGDYRHGFYCVTK